MYQTEQTDLQDRSSAPKRSKPALLSVSVSMVAVLLGAGLMNSAYASSEILSDMDCVIEPSRLVELGSAVPGLLAESYFDRSDIVSAGTVMARLESDVERITLKIAEKSASSSTSVALRRATADFGNRTRVRNAKVMESSGISEQVMDQVNTEAMIASLQVEQEKESARLAELEVERAKARLYKSSGEYVDSEPVFQVAQLDPLHVEVIVPIDYLGRLAVGNAATISIDVPGFTDRRMQATVSLIDAVADAASATFGVRLLLDNPDLSIPGGVRCQVDFISS